MTACALSFNIAPPASVEVARPVLACDRAPPEAPMIKSELIERVTAENPHLYQRDVEKIINAILESIRMSGVFTPRRLEQRRFRCRWRDLDTSARTTAGACRQASAGASAAASGRRVWSTASADA